MWCKIKRVEPSLFDTKNYNEVVYFDFLERERNVSITKKVLNYLNIESINDFNEIFVVKTFIKRGGQEKPIFLVKKVR